MIKRSLATLAVLVALPAGILTTTAISSAGAQSIPHVRVIDAAANRAMPANRLMPANKVRPVKRVIPAKAHCVAKKMNRAHTATTLKCVGKNVSVRTAATAAAQITKTSNTRTGTATPASSGYWACELIDVIVYPDGSVEYDFWCWWVPGDGGGGGS